MKKTLLLAAALTLVAGPAFGQGYRIPEQSINSVALSNAYAANTNGADTSYYNPARMSWLDNKWQSEFSLLYINLPSIEYTHNGDAAKNSGSRDENFLLPNVHLVSPAYNNLRFGFSVIYPFGLSKRWDNPALPKATAEEFTLKTYELNPTVSYKISNRLSVAAGARMLYSDGKVKSNNNNVVTRDLTGDSIDYGYNLAVSFLPVNNWSLAATYRSKIDLTIEGDARLRYLAESYSGYAEVLVPAPAVLTLATSYTWDKTTFEFTYDKTYWSAYDQLNFNYAYPLAGNLKTAFDNPVAKNWVNADAFRFGVTHQCSKRWTVMAGFAIDKTGVPDSTLGFELPDSDAKLYSIGARYQYNERLALGAAYLYDDKEGKSVANSSATAPNGTFDDARAHLLSLGLRYDF
ncbi:MAG: outer membrane protein transport protein [Thermodesulfobacteriota bacterium]